jgi:diacylglycerol kinase (ATP)
VVEAFFSQRHLRFHFIMVAIVVIAARFYGLTRWEMLLLFFAVALVLITELFNTAIETVVDLVTDSYHPLAKSAKDVAAGAVLIAALNALVVAVFLFADENSLHDRFVRLFGTPQIVQPKEVATAGFVLLLVLILIWKLLGRKGSLLHGGVVSGHAALASFLASSIYFTSGSMLSALLGLTVAFLVSQSRVEGRIHTVREVVIGTFLGLFVTILMFALLPNLMARLLTGN